MRVSIYSGRVFRREAGRDSEMKPAAVRRLAAFFLRVAASTLVTGWRAVATSGLNAPVNPNGCPLGEQFGLPPRLHSPGCSGRRAPGRWHHVRRGVTGGRRRQPPRLCRWRIGWAANPVPNLRAGSVSTYRGETGSSVQPLNARPRARGAQKCIFSLYHRRFREVQIS